MTPSRRAVVKGAAAAGLAAILPASSRAATPFSFEDVITIARTASQSRYKPVDTQLPAELEALDYDKSRMIRFRSDRAMWAQDGLGYQLQFFHRGGQHRERVDLYEIVDGQSRPILYDPANFTYGGAVAAPTSDLGLAGFRIHVNRDNGIDELAVFLGASYFRSFAAGQSYGLSARGLAIGTASLKGEEFPMFRSFWIERPQPGAGWVTVYAWLDSPSISGAYAFTITPSGPMSPPTVFDVRSVIFPRTSIDSIGIAPLTSMYMFGPADLKPHDDFRPAVHDSDGLEMRTGQGLSLWRPLANPPRIEESTFVDKTPDHFGLMQRRKRIDDFQDYEARYDRRPSAVVTPHGDWGDGAVHLFELPSDTEGFDNIVSFWRPKAALQAGSSYAFDYRLAWGDGLPATGFAVGRVIQTRTGPSHLKGARLFLVDFELPDSVDTALLTPEALNPESGAPGTIGATLSATRGRVSPVHIQALDAPRTLRAAFSFYPPASSSGAVAVSELSLSLFGQSPAFRPAANSNPSSPLTETWIFRWKP